MVRQNLLPLNVYLNSKEKKIFLLELRNVRYAKTIQLITTLTDGLTYIQPPLIYIEYDELSSADLSAGTLVQVRRMKKNHLSDS